MTRTVMALFTLAFLAGLAAGCEPRTHTVVCADGSVSSGTHVNDRMCDRHGGVSQHR